jgi:hypothetical protein
MVFFQCSTRLAQFRAEAETLKAEKAIAIASMLFMDIEAPQSSQPLYTVKIELLAPTLHRQSVVKKRWPCPKVSKR